MREESKFYKDFIALRYGREWKVNPAEKARLEIILKLVGTGNNVLDIGCYDGTITKGIKDNGNNIIGLDLSVNAVKIARSKGINCIVNNVADRIAFQDDSFDVVLLAEVIEHVFDLSSFIREVKRVLKNGGSLVLSTPNLASLGRRIFLCIGRNPLIEIEMDAFAAGHVRYFVKETLMDFLGKNDFEVKEFCSDVVNFDNSGYRFSGLLAKVFPGLGKSLIVKAVNIK